MLFILDPDDPVPEAFGQYREHERLQIDRQPERAEYMNDAGRGREMRAGLALA